MRDLHPTQHSEQPLVDALQVVKRAVEQLAELDRMLERQAVPEAERAPIANCVLNLYAEESWLRGQLQRTRLGRADPPADAAPALRSGAPPPPAVALMRLFGPRSEAWVEDARGADLCLRLERASGERAVASVATGGLPAASRLIGTATGVDGVRWRVELECEAETRLEEGRSLLALRVCGVQPGTPERLLSAGGETHLEVVECAQIAPLSHVHGEVLQLSAVGFEFATNAPLRAGDRLRFHRRYFAELVDGDVRVETVQPAGGDGTLLVGCWFVDIDARSQAALDRVLTRAHARRSPVDYQRLLSLADPAQEPPRRGLRRLFRPRRRGEP